jgi:hypothetical protein
VFGYVPIHAFGIRVIDSLQQRIELAEVLFADFEVVEPLHQKIAFLSLPEILCSFPASGDKMSRNR